MNKRSVGYFIILMVAFAANAGILDRIRKAYLHHDFEKVEKLVLKSIEKDSINPGARYFYSRLFLDSSFVRRNIDSSSLFIERALDDFHRADADILDDLQDVGVSMDTLIYQRNQVARAAFDRAAEANTLAALEDFRKRFAYSDLLTQATYLRDELAYETTSQKDTWQAYKTYFETYPDSPFVEDARKRYQVLLFKDYTQDNQTSSYVRFLKEHPQTPFRREAEQIIFERWTVTNNKDDYLKFIKNYPNSHLTKKAADILYHKLVNPKDRIPQEVYRTHPNVDSLQTIHDLSSRVLFPIYEEGLFGFMDTMGELIMPPSYKTVQPDYACGAIDDNWLQVGPQISNQLIARNGTVLIDGVVSYRSLSPALKLVSEDGSYLYHASGFKVLDQSVDDAVELANGWIAFKNDYNWGVCALNGTVVLPAQYDHVEMIGPFVIVEREELYAITTPEQLQGNEGLAFQFDDYELLQDTLMQVFNGRQEGVLDANLDFVVPLADHEVYINGAFWYLVEANTYRMIKEEKSKVIRQDFDHIEVNDGWIALKKEDWILLSRRPDGVMPTNGIDSVKLLNEFAAFIKSGDTLELIFQNNERVPLTANNRLSVFTRPGGVASYLSIRDGNEYKLIDEHSELLFLGDFDELTLMADSLFKFKYKGKTGVKRTDGSNLLSPEYDVIDEQDGLLFLLKDGNIGCYDLHNGALIPAEYKARIKRIRGNYEVVKDGKHGLVNPFNKEVIGFDYDEIIDWNDTSLWVRQDLDWSLINLDEEIIVDNIQSVRPWMTVAGELLAVVSGEDGYGLHGNVRGEILPVQYNEIINVGNESAPVFFAEQHLKEAAFYVVTYFAAGGSTLKSKAYRPEEYELVYCED